MSRPLPRAVVPVAGAALALLCGILVLAPIHQHPSSSGVSLLEKLWQMLFALGFDLPPGRLAVVVGVLLAVTLIAVPVLRVEFPGGWGRVRALLAGAAAPGPGAGPRGVPREELRRRARAAGIAWRPAFDDPGGTRALVDLLDRIAPAGAAASGAALDAALDGRRRQGPGLVLLRQEVADESEDVAPAPEPAPTDEQVPRGARDAPARAGLTTPPASPRPRRAVADSAGSGTAPPASWSAGSVYTPTVLYGGSASPAPEEPDGPEGTPEDEERPR